MKKLIVLLMAGLVLQGCGSVGNVTMKEQSESTINLTKGKTTRQEVMERFGTPLNTSFTDSGNKIYTYIYDDASAFTPETVVSAVFTWGLAGSKTRGERRELAVLFDSNDTVKTYHVSVSKVEGGTMLFK